MSGSIYEASKVESFMGNARGLEKFDSKRVSYDMASYIGWVSVNSIDISGASL